MTANLNLSAHSAEQQLLMAAQAWWAQRRPQGWTEAQHQANPLVNTQSPEEQALACAMARLVSEAPPLRTFQAKLCSRKELLRRRDEEGQVDVWGWWADTCPGKSLTLREATPADLARCIMSEGWSRDPADWLCELGNHGALVSRKALSSLTPLTPTNAPTAPNKMTDWSAA